MGRQLSTKTGRVLMGLKILFHDLARIVLEEIKLLRHILISSRTIRIIPK